MLTLLAVSTRSRQKPSIFSVMNCCTNVLLTQAGLACHSMEQCLSVIVLWDQSECALHLARSGGPKCLHARCYLIVVVFAISVNSFIILLCTKLLESSFVDSLYLHCYGLVSMLQCSFIVGSC